MKAKGFLFVALAAVIALSISIAALANDNATITINMSGPAVAIDIQVEPATWDIESVQLNSSYAKDFTLANRGSIRVDTTIVGTDAEGAGYHWSLGSLPGDNTYEIEYDIEGMGGTGNVITTPTDFVQNLRSDQSARFSLTIKTPSAGGAPGAGEAMRATVTIHAVQA